MNNKTKFEAIIFDLDGTLLNSLLGIADAMNILLERLHFPTHPLGAYKYFVGDGIIELVKRALPGEKEQESDIPTLVKEYRKIYDTTWPLESPPYEGILELLESLSKKRIKMAILSNKSHDFTQRMVVQLLPGIHFAEVRGVVDGGTRKPDPSGALDICNIMGTTPGNTVFVGDTSIDMKTAVRAEMYPVGVLWGFRPEKELLENGAKKLVSWPMEIDQLF